MARWLNCKEDTIPFHYLGLPVGGSMNKAASWQPVIEKFKSRLSNWKAKQLSFGGRLCLCKFVLGSLGTYFFSLYKAPKKVLNSLESIRCRFFWVGTENEKKINWVAWDKILRDKVSGGLGVGSLKALNLAMLGKWWWRDRTESGAKWKVVVNNCNATHSPNINSRGNKGVWRRIQGIDKDLRDMGINLDYLLQQKEDGSGWIWRLDTNNNFTVSSLRKLIDRISLPPAESKTEWIKWVPSKANIHLWRTRCNRLATKDNLIKRGVSLQSEECTMCNAKAENLDHVLAQCSSTKIVAAFLSRWVDWWLRSESSISGIWTAIGSNSGKLTIFIKR